MTKSKNNKQNFDENLLLSLRLFKLIEQGYINQGEAEKFKTLETEMNQGKSLGKNYLASYQKSDDIYKHSLEKIISSLADIGEPHAAEKYRVVVEEMATMGPGVFLTPWEITLSYLDRYYGKIQDIIDFYA